MERDRERLAYVFGAEVLAEVEGCDLDDEFEVMGLVEQFLPVQGQSQGGARSAMRVIAVRQILDDDPPQAWRAVQRMSEAGLDREAVLGQLAMAIAGTAIEALSDGERSDPARLVAALDALPLPAADDVARALLAAVRAEPGITADELVDCAVGALGSPAISRVLEPMVDRVLDRLVEGPLHWLAGDSTVVFHDVIEGRTFTHCLTEFERELGTLTVSVDLAAFDRFDVVRLEDGSEIDQVSAEPGHLAWRGPDGWLDVFEPGDLLAVRAAFDPPAGDEPVEATIDIRVVAKEPAMMAVFAEAVRAAYDDEQREHGLPVSFEELAVWLCCRRPELFMGELPPLSQWCDAAGLESNGNKVAHDSSVWRRESMLRHFHRIADEVVDRHWRGVLGRAVEVLCDPETSADDIRSSLGE
jgi:hypothetical protein